MSAYPQFTLDPQCYLAEDEEIDLFGAPEIPARELKSKDMRVKHVKKERKPGRFAEQDGEVKKIYWSISEVAKILDAPQSKIRFYDNLYNICRRRTGNKVRRFTNSQVELLRNIIKAKDYLTHDGISALIAGDIFLSFKKSNERT